MRRVKKLLVMAAGLSIILLALLFWPSIKSHRVEREINSALRPAILSATEKTGKKWSTMSESAQHGLLFQAPLPRETTNRWRALGPDVVPILIQWSRNEPQPFQATLAPLLSWFGYRLPRSDSWTNAVKAVKVMEAVQLHAIGAVPILVGQLSDTNILVRRFSAEMLGALGPLMGTNAFQQFTNVFLKDFNKDMRLLLIWTLSKDYNLHRFPAETLIPVFSAGVRDSHPKVQEAGREAMVALARRTVKADNAVNKAVTDLGLEQEVENKF